VRHAARHFGVLGGTPMYRVRVLSLYEERNGKLL
jgi:hypothetical protein